MTANKENNTRIYFDNSASTAVDERVVEAMNPYWSEKMGNAGSIHQEGRQAKEALELARKTIAKIIHAQPENIIFTSGGTESNNLAVLGVVNERKSTVANDHEVSVVTSMVEHKSILDAFGELERRKVEVSYIPTDETGKADVELLRESLRKNTSIVSLVYVNNEIGTIQDIQSVMHIVRKFRKEHDTGQYPLVHLDASQAPVWLHVDVQKLGVDLLTLDSQKVYGPKGIGCLYARDTKLLKPILFGGGQEMGLRPGTPPVPLIVGFARAMEIVEEERDTYVNNIREVRDWCIQYVQKELPDTVVNGPLDENRIAGNVSFSFPCVDGEQVVLEMDVRGVAISTASACLSENEEGSHVVRALCKDGINVNGTIRISFGRHTEMEEVQKGIKTLVETVSWLRSSSGN